MTSIPHINLGEHHGDTDVPIDQAQVVEEFIHEDANVLMSHFRETYQHIITNVRKPNVLIIGFCGAGKSSIINTVFGKDVAQEGAGKPMTQHFEKHSPANKPIVIYDSKGIEAGMHFDEFMEDTEMFFKNQSKEKGVENIGSVIHLVWYVINSAAARFQDFEERICKELFADLPIVFLLNKSDISTDEQKDELRRIIYDMHLPNCLGVFETCTSKYAELKRVDECPKCGDQDIVIYRRKQIALCEHCGVETPLTASTGLSQVMEVTINELPAIAREAFIAAQNVSFRLKDKRASKVIVEFYDEQTHCFTPSQLLLAIAKMLTRLSFLWEFREHGHLYGAHIAKDLIKGFSFRDKLFLFMHKNKHQRLRATAIGIIWNRCVRNLAKKLLAESVENHSVDENWTKMMEETFSDLCEECVDELEERLEDGGLERVLNEEMPGDDHITVAPERSTPVHSASEESDEEADSPEKTRRGSKPRLKEKSKDKESGGRHTRRKSGTSHSHHRTHSSKHKKEDEYHKKRRGSNKDELKTPTRSKTPELLK